MRSLWCPRVKKAPAWSSRPRQKAPGVRMRVGEYRVPPDVAARIRAGHPWIFRDALGSRGVTEPTGTVVDVLSGNHDFVCRGYVDQEHAVAVRVLTRDPGQRVVPGAGAIAARLERAGQLRWFCFGADRPQAMRLFSGEHEGLPAVTVDRYGDFPVAQCLSSGPLPRR